MNHWLDCYQICMLHIGHTIEWFGWWGTSVFFENIVLFLFSVYFFFIFYFFLQRHIYQYLVILLYFLFIAETHMFNYLRSRFSRDLSNSFNGNSDTQ